MSQCGYCLPIKNSNRLSAPIKVAVKQTVNLDVKRGNTPFFSLSDEAYTVKLFVDALSKSRHEDAKVYISKNFAKDFDLDELSDFFNKMHQYKHLIKVEFSATPKNCKTNSILVLNSDSKRNSIIHLHLVKEPDYFSKWKIYGIEKE